MSDYAAGNERPLVPYSRLRTRVFVWSAPALLGVVYAQSIATSTEPNVPAWKLMCIALATWYVWVLFTPPIERLSDRFPLRGGRRVRHGMVHALAAVSCTVLQSVATAVSTGLVGAAPWSQVPRIVPEWFVVLLPAGSVVYAAVVAFRTVTVTRFRLEQRDRQAEQLALQLRNAQLAALRAQLQPHFLFNTLTAITALVRDHETVRAAQALEQLSVLLRSALRADDRHEAPLVEEIERVRHYLHIEELRMGRPVHVETHISEAAALAMVPAWILQPVIENCMRHGFRGQSTDCTLTLRAQVADERVTVVVADNGIGLAPDWERRVALGYGISNSRARLAALYGDAASLHLDSVSPRGATTSLTLPYRTVVP